MTLESTDEARAVRDDELWRPSIAIYICGGMAWTMGEVGRESKHYRTDDEQDQAWEGCSYEAQAMMTLPKQTLPESAAAVGKRQQSSAFKRCSSTVASQLALDAMQREAAAFSQHINDAFTTDGPGGQGYDPWLSHLLPLDPRSNPHHGA